MRRRRRPEQEADLAVSRAEALVRELAALNEAAATLLEDLSESLDTEQKDRRRHD